MNNDNRKHIGSLGEKQAKKYLCAQGMKFLAANWRCRIGEIDLVFFEGWELVIVEVKTRLESPYAERHLLDNITLAKKRKLRSLADYYVNSALRRFPSVKTKLKAIRIDVVGVVLTRSNCSLSSLKHLRNAV